MNNLQKILLNLFFIPLFWIFSYIIPKNKGLVALGSYFGYKFAGNPKYFYLYLLNKKNIKQRPFWVTRNKEIYKVFRKELRPVVYLYSLSGIWKVLRAEYLFIEESSQDITGTAFILGRFNIVNTWHGTFLKKFTRIVADKKSLYFRLFNFFTKKEMASYKFFLACSECAASDLRLGTENKNIKILGYPRNDIFFDKELSYKNYGKDLNLRQYNKVLLYAPTFRDNKNEMVPFSEDFLLRLNKLLKKKKYILLVKNHPSYLFGRKMKISALDNVLDVSMSVDDIQEILANTDVLITDYSSTIFEFCLTNKPMILYSYDYDDYIKNCRGMNFGYYEEMIGPFAKNERQLFELIESIDYWSNEKSYKKRYELFKNRFNQYQDGGSCERLLAEL
jgi:CDP-glycerol glycerophosphotransferase (TagB/SpsB family)